jgi:hypothetical protein
MFPTIGLFVYKILSIIGSQIETQFFFSWQEYKLILGDCKPHLLKFKLINFCEQKLT